MPNNTTTAPKKKRTFKVKVPKEKVFKVTLTLSFEQHVGDSEDLEKGEHGYDDETNEEFCKRVQDWIATDKAYGTDEKIQRYVKSFDALGFVENLPPGEVLSAEWLSGFKISFITKPEGTHYNTAEEIKSWLEDMSLEDGEYESSGDNGWTVKTLKGMMEYGLTDYRRNPIVVEEIERPAQGGKRKARRQTRRRR